MRLIGFPSSTGRRRNRRMQPDLRPSLGESLRHGSEHGIRLCQYKRAIECRPCHPPTCGVCCECESGEDSRQVLQFLREEYSV